MKVSKISIFMFMMFFFVFRPSTLSYIDGGITDKLSRIVYLGMMFYILFGMITKKQKMFPDTGTINIYLLALVVITIINGSFTVTYYNTLSKMFVDVMMISYYLNKDKDKCLKLLEVVLAAYVIVNLITVIIFPNGIYQQLYVYDQWGSDIDAQWIFGQKNGFAKYIISLLLVSGIRANNKDKLVDLKFLIFYLLSLISVVAAGSSTAIIVLLLLAIYLMVYKVLKHYNLFNVKVVFVLAVIINILFISSNTAIFSNIIQILTGKTAGLSNRTIIWTRVLIYFVQKPLIGFGYLNEGAQHNMLGHVYFNSTHNMILQVMFFGGILLLILFINIFYRIMKRLDNFSNKKTVYFLTSIIMAIAVEGLTESLITSSTVFVCLQIILRTCIDTKPWCNTEGRINE